MTEHEHRTAKCPMCGLDGIDVLEGVDPSGGVIADHVIGGLGWTACPGGYEPSEFQQKMDQMRNDTLRGRWG